jgi:uncharacterized membrane protein (DUF373 family)
MNHDENRGRTETRLSAFAGRTFVKIEILTYLVLGLMLALAALLGIWTAGVSLWDAVQEHGAADSLVFAVDRLLFVLMVIEILHTVRASFRAGTLVCEPFLIVGLIASIRRVLVITLETSQANKPGSWTPESEALLRSTMLELAVLGGLILVMVVSIYMLRRSETLRRLERSGAVERKAVEF